MGIDLIVHEIGITEIVIVIVGDQCQFIFTGSVLFEIQRVADVQGRKVETEIWSNQYKHCQYCEKHEGGADGKGP